ncbi:MAG: Fe-S cluster assembly protein IscX [Pseudomonadota bacterium]
MTQDRRTPTPTFSWDDQQRIVEGLETQYPRVSRVSLTPADLDTMIRSLPGFVNGKGPPDDGIYNRLLVLWIALDEDDDDGRWDAGA